MRGSGAKETSGLSDGRFGLAVGHQLGRNKILGDGLEAVPGTDTVGQLLQLAGQQRITSRFHHLAQFIAALAGLGQTDLRIWPQGNPVFLALGAVFQEPKL